MRLSALTTVLMHVVPIGIIQVADYVSDIFVVLDFYEHAKKTSDPDDALWWQVGLGFICGSVLAAFVLCIMVFIFQRQARINGDNAILEATWARGGGGKVPWEVLPADEYNPNTGERVPKGTWNPLRGNRGSAGGFEKPAMPRPRPGT